MAIGYSPARGRRPSFTEEQLIGVALDIGPHGISLREVADRLGVARMTVYNRVNSPEALGRLVLLSVLNSVAGSDTPHIGQAGWRAQVETYALRTRDKMFRAGAWLRFFDPAAHIGTSGLREADDVIRSLVEAGLDIVSAAHALKFINVIVGDAVLLHMDRLRPGFEEIEVLANLDADDFPWLAAARAAARPSEDETQFLYNLECALAGVAAMIARARPGC